MRHLLLAFLTLFVVALWACTDGTPLVEPEADPPDVFFKVNAGNLQHAKIGTELPTGIMVQVLDAKGKYIAGAPVNFVVTKGGGSIWSGMGFADSRGFAADWWTLGPEVGEQNVEARFVEVVKGQGSQRYSYGEFRSFAYGPNWIAVGWNHRCVLRTSGVGRCWGEDGDGQLGDGNPVSTGQEPVRVRGHNDFRMIAVGWLSHSCAVDASGYAWCWGDNTTGALGIGSFGGKKTSPQAVYLGNSGLMKSVTAGHGFTCGLAADGRAYCWGSDFGDQLGISPRADTPEPVAVGQGDAMQSDALRWHSIDAGWGHVCGVTVTGKLYCWGRNELAQAGQATSPSVPAPREVLRSDERVWSQVSAGGDHSCALDFDGAAYCWGQNDHSQLGLGATGLTETPVPHPIVHSAGQEDRYHTIVAGRYRTCAIRKSSGEVVCWGDAFGLQPQDNTPPSPNVFDYISGNNTFCGRTPYHVYEDGSATTGGDTYCWFGDVPPIKIEF